MDQHQFSAHSNESNKAINIAYAALIISFLSLGVSGWILYKDLNKPKSTSDKIDTFFQQQDEEFDKMFEEGENNEK